MHIRREERILQRNMNSRSAVLPADAAIDGLLLDHGDGSALRARLDAVPPPALERADPAVQDRLLAPARGAVQFENLQLPFVKRWQIFAICLAN